MLVPLSNLLLVTRIEGVASAGLLASGTLGTFVSFVTGASDSETKFDLPAAAGNFAIPIWTESANRFSTSTTGVWSPDALSNNSLYQMGTGQLTGIYGKLRALTDQYSGSAPTIGAALYATTAGKLSMTAGNGVVLGYCTKPPHAYTYLGKSYTVIEFVLA